MTAKNILVDPSNVLILEMFRM